MTGAVLALNVGSSSLKFALYDAGLSTLLRGHLQRREGADHFLARTPTGEAVVDELRASQGALTDESLIARVFEIAEARSEGGRLAAVAHRIVHGGGDFSGPVRLDAGVLRKLKALNPLAPLHQPQGLAGVRGAMALRPALPQTASFDTAFHRTQAEVVTRLALPRAWHAKGVRRYGFHGLSYDYVAERLRALDPTLAAGKVLAAHLGAGASLCMMEDGRSLDTTMGFTALDGLVMGTRCGALDPGVVLYLLQQEKMKPAEVEDLLYRRSGLLGVSGISADMGVLLESAERAAHEAIELFTFRIAREAGALMSVAGGLDGLVFTAGVGENVPAIREAVAARLAWTGMRLDPAANAAGAGLISAPDSAVRVWVVPTNEEFVIARQAVEVLKAASRPA